MHGGLVATLADELSGVGVHRPITGKFGVTASFDARYLQPARIGKEIEGRAHIVQSAGRSIDIEVKLPPGGAPLASRRRSDSCCSTNRAWRKCLGRELPEDWNRFTR